MVNTSASKRQLDVDIEPEDVRAVDSVTLVCKIG